MTLDTINAMLSLKEDHGLMPVETVLKVKELRKLQYFIQVEKG